MKVFPNPENPIWNQTNTTDLFGNLYATRNISLDKDGYISLSKRVTAIASTIDDRIKSLCFANSQYKGVATNTIVNIATSTLALTLDTNTNSGLVNNSSRIIYWNETTYYSNNTSLRKLVLTNYTSVMTLTSTSTLCRPLCSFENKILLAVGDGNIIRTIDESNVAGATLVLPKQYIAIWIKYFGNKIYIGTINMTGEDAFVFVWDGATAQAEAAYPVFSGITVSGVFFNSTLYILNGRGILLAFSGGGFDEVARIPSANDFMNLPFALFDSYNSDHMCVSNGSILIGLSNRLIYGTSTDRFVGNFYSGIWSYNRKYGFIHQYSSASSTSSTSPTGFGVTYRYQSFFMIYPIPETYYMGAISASLGSRILISDGGNSIKQAVSSVTTGENRGYVQTNKIVSVNPSNLNKKIYIKYRNVDDTNDKIVIKYKDRDVTLLPNNAVITATFTSANTFTSTNAIFENVIAGYEVELLSGTTSSSVYDSGSGSMAHISSISNAAGTYTVVLDENVIITLPITNGICFVKVDNFIKVITIDKDTNNIDQTIEVPIDVTSKWISIKVEMRGEDVEIEQLLLVDEVDTPAV